MADEDRVLIAGAGPVGMITGLALARQGIPVILFEALDDIPEDHRAATVHASSLEILDDIGMTAILHERGLTSPIFQYRDRESGEIVAEFDFRVMADETPYPYAVQCEQHKVVAIAEELAKGFPDFDLRRRQSVTGFKQSADGVEVTVETRDGIERHKGRYLIGCEGGSSIIRKDLGIEFPGFTWPERFIIVATPFDFCAADGWRNRNYVAHPVQWCALMKVPGTQPGGLFRVLFPALDAAVCDEEVQSDEWIQARFQECLPYIPEYTIEHRNLYAVHQRVAESFRQGRVMLAGDSAHINNPIGGMGMNSGIHDGMNLAEKIGLVWRGEAGEEIFNLYDRQRRPMAVKYVQAQSIRNKETLQESDPKIRRQRLDELRQAAEDPEKTREFVRRTSLMAMLREANAIE